MPKKSAEVVQDVAPAGDVYTMAEAARLKGVSYHTVSRAVRRGKLPATRLGRMALITAEDLRDWRPMRERAPRKYRRREPNPDAAPAMLDLASGERVELAGRIATLYEVLHSSAAELPVAEFLAVLADRIGSALDLKRLVIWGVDENEGKVRKLAAFGPAMSTLQAHRAFTPTTELAAALAAGDPKVMTLK
ncbi:MAG: helix-turn-helix domain-containing protein, partial [Chloroflexota bacterium]